MTISKRVIFVFGSNLAGIHGKGDALLARYLHGALLGVGEGLQGDSYGLPTKDKRIQALSLADIAVNVDRLLEFARAYPDWSFDVQRVGCKNAGYTPDQIAPLFSRAPANMYLHADFVKVLTGLGVAAVAGPAPRSGDIGDLFAQ